MPTAILLAGLTYLFMALGYLTGGGSGALIAVIIAAENKMHNAKSSMSRVCALS